MPIPYAGRIAPTPTGWLHIGHAATFAMAHRRARDAGGRLILRIEDIDLPRCKPEFTEACVEDLRWLGLDWDGEPVFQSHRRDIFVDTWRRLRDGGFIYPSEHSRRDVETAAQAPHDEEPIFPVEWRRPTSNAGEWQAPAGVNWRFRVPDGEVVEFGDEHAGEVRRVAGRDFGDFVVWRRDDIPAYELAVVADDIDMQITEIVRGEDLLTSTARQILLYRALGAPPPRFFHCKLVRDQSGQRLAKRHAALSIRALRESGKSPSDVLAMA